MSINEKHKKIKEWLEFIYIDEEIPSYDINQKTIDHLYTMMTNNQTQDHDTQLHIEHMRHKAKEYDAEAERQNKILKQIGMDYHNLSQSGVTSVQTLARLADILQLKYTSDSCYMLALRRLDRDLAQVAQERKVVERVTENLFEKKKKFLLKLAKWKKALEDFEEEQREQMPEIKSYAKSALFLQAKAKEYRKQERKHLERLRKLDLDPSEYHSALVRQAEALEKLKEKLRPLKAKLNSYHSLPPDITMTKVKIEEVKQQLGYLEREINRRINVMHM